jgi:hypothetical protein
MYPLKWKHTSSAKKDPTRETLLGKNFVVDKTYHQRQQTQLEQG